MLTSVFLVVCLSVLVSPKSFYPLCYQEPDNLEVLKEQLLVPLIELSTHETVNNIPGLIKSTNLIGPDDIPPNFVRIRRVPDSSFTMCPMSRNISSVNLDMRTTCPKTWVLNDDPNRWPRTVGEVDCLCDRCLDYSSDGTRTQNRCETVFYYIRALRRVGCDGHYFRYSEVSEMIQISCTCAEPYVRISTGHTNRLPTN